ncbi:GDSL-type esterase/lipase family protein [Gammaproteobacteria bacterium]|nr:GDSL-type esterase/lipase family protein [Gammaproteobacteria bacterium]
MFFKDTNTTTSSIWVYLSLALLLSYCHCEEYDGIILGDSISSGYGVEPKENWVYLWQSSLTCKLNILNLSVQGATTADGLNTLNYFYANHTANWMILELGGNDGLRGLDLDQMKSRLDALITLAENNQTKVLLVSTDLPINYGKDFRTKFQEAFDTIAKQHHLIHLKLQFPEDVSLIQSDGIHPSASGHQRIAQTLQPLSAEVCNKY